MSQDQAFAFAILLGALALFAWGRLRYDVVAALALGAAVALGLVPGADAFAGFGHPAVITVALVLMISHGLKQSGLVERMAGMLAPLTGPLLLHIAALTAVVAVASAFMNNVGALALMLPVALATAAERKRSPALLLMPLAFGSILGGMTTMIGTPPNVIIATFRADYAGAPFAMFDFSPVGVAVAAVGVVFVALVGWRMIPAERRAQNPPQQLFAIDDYLTEIEVGKSSPLVDERLEETKAFDDAAVDVIGLIRHGSDRPISVPRQPLKAGDVLLVRGDPEALEPLMAKLDLKLAQKPSAHLKGDELTLAEGVVSPGAALEGRGLRYLRRRTGGALAVVALARQGRPPRGRLTGQTFRAGDVLLLHGQGDALDDWFATLGLLPLAARGLSLGQKRRMGLALGVFAAAILTMTLGLAPAPVALAFAVIAYVLLDVLPLRDLYREIDWPVVVLLGAMIPVGGALQETGAAALAADAVARLSAGAGPLLVLAFVLVLAMFLSDVINNVATALVMAPIAIGIADRLDANPDSFLMAVAVGSSCAFLTPIGHQSNTLVMGPGGYRFGDYWRMGLPLEAAIVAVGVPMIAFVWPL